MSILEIKNLNIEYKTKSSVFGEEKVIKAVNNLSLKELYSAFAPSDLKKAYSLTSAFLSSHINVKGKLEEYNIIFKSRLSNLALNDTKKTMFISNKFADVDFRANQNEIKGKFDNEKFIFSYPQMKTKAAIENLNVGITIMVIGMATVFVFLAIMIVAMNITTKIISVINKYFPEPIPEQKNIRKKKQDDESEIALAIVAALNQQAKIKEQL